MGTITRIFVRAFNFTPAFPGTAGLAASIDVEGYGQKGKNQISAITDKEERVRDTAGSIVVQGLMVFS
jgi:hypothetical protein